MPGDRSTRQLPQLLSAATLARAHGVRGEMKVRCRPEILDVLATLARDAVTVTIRMPQSGDEYEVTLGGVRGHESAPILAVDGVEDRAGADRFRGGLLLVPRDALPPAQDGEYYLADLTGCTAHDVATGRCVGQVEDAQDLPANVVLTVRLESGESVLVPLIDDAVADVDVESGRIELRCDFLDIAVPGDDPTEH